MSNIDLVIEVCRKLHSQGKTPTAALVKYNAPRSITFPEIINGLTMWKELDPAEQSIKEDDTKLTNSTTSSFETTKNTTLSDDDFLKLPISEQLLYLKHTLEKEITSLHEEISNIRNSL